ncbi:carboxylesterase family protein [Chryseobacterium sp. WG23]|uniref:carboxylesterase/lipase family protein n=1 Tax=Chryseobacterium sp. WG23 TaxID=2926910 RepID=UPI00211EF151|nr:carboxylesterase family protein [Chryseobacterium sp. WG23]MCQ9637517.1 carboxylesterase family protein [Chryseobacterium sp. WG23]
MSDKLSLTVQTRCGKVQGIVEKNGVSAWLGIPYSQPPVGQLNFKAPQPLQEWDGVYDATKFRAVSPQKTDSLTESMGEEVMSEDCLYLNIWSPKADGKLPVMFWIHGGGFLNGSGSGPMYQGANIARSGNVVIVTINYRLGPWGFLHLGDIDKNFDSNIGIRDQIAALTWVKENIAAFGGDPENITIFGESAGGASVFNLIGSPVAKGLFQKAIAESPSEGCIYKDPELATKVARRFLQILEISESDITGIKNLPFDVLLTKGDILIEEVIANLPGNIAFQPFIGDEILPVHPLQAVKNGSGSRVPVIIGFNENEYSIYNVLPMPQLMPITESKIRMYLQQNYPEKADQIYDAYNDMEESERLLEIGQDLTIISPATQMARVMLEYISDVYMYYFCWTSDHLKSLGLGCFHSLEVSFVFNNLNWALMKEVRKGVDEQEIQNLSKNMQRAWTNFAHTGNPNHTDDYLWSPYSIVSESVIIFDKEISTGEHPKRKYMKVWTE